MKKLVWGNDNMTEKELRELKEKVGKIEKPGEIEKILEHKTMYERFRDTAMRKPDSVALMYFGNNITYRQLLTLIDTAANGFSEIGIKYNDVVAMSMLGTPYGIVSLYALDKIGAVMHMVNCASNASEIKRELEKVPSKYFVGNDIFYNEDMKKMLDEVGIEKVVTTSLLDGLPMGFNIDKLKYSFIEKVKGPNKRMYDDVTMINFDKLLSIGRNSKFKVQACSFEPNKLVSIAYTSGSTGNSKGCMATWEGIDSMIQVMGMTELGRFEETDVMFSTFPLWIYYSLLNMIHEPLVLGVSLALDPLFNPKDIAKRNNMYKFNHWLTIPPYIKTMVENTKNIDCSRWKLIITGGAELSNSLKIQADEFIKRNNGSAHVEQGYGASECLGSFSYGYTENPTIGSLGTPCVGNKIKILDVDTNEELGVLETGVAYLYSPALMAGYYGDEEATRHNLVTDENGVTWYNTEDLVSVNEKGELFLDGRIRRIALSIDAKGNPTKIIPERTKRCLSMFNGISKCEVITVPDDKVVNKAVAFVVLNSGVLPTEDLKNSMISYCQGNIPEYMVPTDIIYLDELPINASKKVDLKELERIYNEEFVNNNIKKRKLR